MEQPSEQISVFASTIINQAIDRSMDMFSIGSGPLQITKVRALILLARAYRAHGRLTDFEYATIEQTVRTLLSDKGEKQVFTKL